MTNCGLWALQQVPARVHLLRAEARSWDAWERVEHCFAAAVRRQGGDSVKEVADTLWTQHFVGRPADRGSGARTCLVWEMARDAIRSQPRHLRQIDRIAQVCFNLLDGSELYQEPQPGDSPSRRGQIRRLSQGTLSVLRAVGALVEKRADQFQGSLGDAVAGYAGFWSGTDQDRICCRTVDLDSAQKWETAVEDWPNWALSRCAEGLANLEAAYEDRSPGSVPKVALAMVERGLTWIIGEDRSELAVRDRRKTTILLVGVGRPSDGQPEENGMLAGLIVTKSQSAFSAPVPFPDPVWLGMTLLDEDWRRSFDAASEFVAQGNTQKDSLTCYWSLDSPPSQSSPCTAGDEEPPSLDYHTARFA